LQCSGSRAGWIVANSGGIRLNKRVMDRVQLDLFAADSRSAYRPDPDKVRSRLHKILAEAKAAKKLPWEPTTVSLYRTIFPQMTNWLPEDEGAQLRFEFETEIARLEAA
jgi:hypothetical protein